MQLCFDFCMIEAKPENLIGDPAYRSDPLDEELRNDGIEMIAPHRSNRSKPPTQDRRRLSRLQRRWLVERGATKHVPGAGPGKHVPSVGPHATSGKTENGGIRKIRPLQVRISGLFASAGCRGKWIKDSNVLSPIAL